RERKDGGGRRRSCACRSKEQRTDGGGQVKVAPACICPRPQNRRPIPVRALLMVACIDCMSTNSHSPRTNTLGIMQISIPKPAAYPRWNLPSFRSACVTGPKFALGRGGVGGFGGVGGSGTSVLV